MLVVAVGYRVMGLARLVPGIQLLRRARDPTAAGWRLGPVDERRAVGVAVPLQRRGTLLSHGNERLGE